MKHVKSLILSIFTFGTFRSLIYKTFSFIIFKIRMAIVIDPSKTINLAIPYAIEIGVRICGQIPSNSLLKSEKWGLWNQRSVWWTCVLPDIHYKMPLVPQTEKLKVVHWYQVFTNVRCTRVNTVVNDVRVAKNGKQILILSKAYGKESWVKINAFMSKFGCPRLQVSKTQFMIRIYIKSVIALLIFLRFFPPKWAYYSPGHTEWVHFSFELVGLLDDAFQTINSDFTLRISPAQRIRCRIPWVELRGINADRPQFSSSLMIVFILSNTRMLVLSNGLHESALPWLTRPA